MSKRGNKITVLLADDHAIVREGLRHLIEARDDMMVIGEAADGVEAVALAQECSPDVVILDVTMPRLNGLEAARQIMRARPQTRILMLSAHTNESYFREAKRVGAEGYLIKQTSGQSLAQAIREVHNGNDFFEPLPARPPLHHFSEPTQAAAKMALSSREVEVLQFLAEGLANKQMAARLGISVKTIEKHRQSLRNKLGLRDTASLIRHAIAMGLVN